MHMRLYIFMRLYVCLKIKVYIILKHLVLFEYVFLKYWNWVGTHLFWNCEYVWNALRLRKYDWIWFGWENIIWFDLIRYLIYLKDQRFVVFEIICFELVWEARIRKP